MIGEKIKKLRIEKNISQTELANILFVSRQTIGRWEREQTIPNTENIVMLANFFEVETSAFLILITIIKILLLEKGVVLSNLRV